MAESATWDDELRRLIADTWKVGDIFSLEEVYGFEQRFQKLYPRNSHRFDKLRQTLQHLRDADEIEFIDNDGHYRRLA